MKIDLHSHTRYSDGQLTPAELIDRAHTMQVDVLAITDHDTTDGVDEAMVHQQSYKRPLQVIPGVELSTSWHGFDIHILGLNVQHQDPVFQQRLAQQSQSRFERAQKIADKLAKAGVADTLEDAQKLAGGSQIGRLHFATVLHRRGLVKDFQAAFDKYLGKGKRAHVSPKWISIEEAVKWIRDAGGNAVLAHPGNYDMTSKWLRRLLSEFKAAGGEGMEMGHGRLSLQKQQLLIELAEEFDLQGSIGSDFHYPGRWVELGKTLSLPPQLVPIWQQWN